MSWESLLIETRESKDWRVQAGLASQSPAFKGLADLPESFYIIGPCMARLAHGYMFNSQAVNFMY